MNEYRTQALDFLAKANAKMEINFIGVDANPNWRDNKKRNKYHFTITTPSGTMSGDFWDSIHHTELTMMTLNDYYKRPGLRNYHGFREMKANAKPNEYDILACLTKCDPGTMDDFLNEMGFEIKSVNDMSQFLNTYNAVVAEYHNLCRIFTPEQMEMLNEII